MEPLISVAKARAKASRPSYRRGGLVLGRIDWVEFSPETVDLVGLRALLADPVVLIEAPGESGAWRRLSVADRQDWLGKISVAGSADELVITRDERMVGPGGEAGSITEFGAMQAEIDDLKVKLVASVQQAADQAVTIEALTRENAQLKAKVAAKPPKPAPPAKAPKAPKATTPPASPASAEEAATPAAEAPPPETAPET